MTAGKIVGVLVVVAVVVVGGHDGVEVANANREVRNTAANAAAAAAHAIFTSHDPAQGRRAADQAAAAAGDIVTSYNYDAVASLVKVTLSGHAATFVLGRLVPSLTDDIAATATRKPG